jgi:hypothetical protein
MIGHISLAEKVDADFSHALRKALLRRVGACSRRDLASDRLLCFDEVRMFHGAAVGRVYRSIRAVPVEQIGGSVGRCSEFDRDFMADRVGGKYILIGGLVLFATGMGYVDWIAEVNSGRWSFLPGLIVAGVGLGFTWTPLYNIAMRDVQPRVAGIAAGVGALLQGRFAAAIQDEATRRAGQLPSEFCDWFLDGFRQGTRGGLEFGTNQAGGGVQATPGIPARVAKQLEQLAEEVFKNAFVEAMHLTLILPIAVVLLAVISCFAVRQGKVKTRPESMEQVEDAA